jgi:hypothetical protein
MKITRPGNFACKDKDVRRDLPQITMNINAENKGRGHGQNTFACSRMLARGFCRAATPQKTKPGAVSRLGTPTQFQFHE